MSDLKQTLQEQLDHLQEMQYQVRPLVFAPPASAQEIAELENELGIPLPPSFRKVLAQISSHVEFCWFAPDGLEYPEPFRSNFSGDLHWSLKFTHQFNQEKNSWVDQVFPNREDPYDAVWHDKLAFFEVGNGDYLALDLASETYGQVVYLSHEDGAGHGYALAENFEQLLVRWVPLACTGGDDWQWLPFCAGKSSFLDPYCSNADAWCHLIGMRA